MKKYLILLLFQLSFVAQAQDLLGFYDSTTAVNSHRFQNKLDKKFLWGFHYNLSWSTVADIDSISIFTKPSVGACIVANYFPLDWLGFSIGVGHQMRGFGIYTPDVDKELGNPDSTHRMRIRTNNFDVP